MRLTNWKFQRNQEMGAKIGKALKSSEKQDFPVRQRTNAPRRATGAEIPQEAGVQDAASGGVPGPTRLESHQKGVKIETQTATKPAPSSNLPVPVLAEACHSLSRDTVTRTPEARESTTTAGPTLPAFSKKEPDSRGGQNLSELDPACDGWGNLWEEVGKAFFGK